jgi:hypothetical protein
MEDNRAVNEIVLRVLFFFSRPTVGKTGIAPQKKRMLTAETPWATLLASPTVPDNGGRNGVPDETGHPRFSSRKAR